KLAWYGLTVEDLKDAVTRQHSEQPAGIIESKRVEANLRTMGEAYSLREWNRLVILQRPTQQITLSDVATVEDGTEDKRSFARYTRMPAIAIGVRKAIGGNLVAVCENVKKEAGTPEKPGKLRKMLPEGVELNIPVDSSVYVRENVEELKLTLFLGIVF